MGRGLATALMVLAVTASTGCAIEGTPTWPGARLERVLLTADDFPPGVQFGRIAEERGGPDGEGGPPAMLSQPEGCSDGLTRVIAASVERGPGSAGKYVVAYDGARIVMTVLTSSLDLDQLALKSVRPNSLVYQQTMQLQGTESSVYFSFENIGEWATFAIAFPTPVPSISVKGTLPQTFLDITARQAERLEQP